MQAARHEDPGCSCLLATRARRSTSAESDAAEQHVQVRLTWLISSEQKHAIVVTQIRQHCAAVSFQGFYTLYNYTQVIQSPGMGCDSLNDCSCDYCTDMANSALVPHLVEGMTNLIPVIFGIPEQPAREN